jgi:AsmA protein
MASFAQRALVGAAAAVAAIAVALVVVPPLFPTGFIKRDIAAAVFARTGRELDIAGPLRVSLLPRLAITADDVTLANAPGGVAPHLFEIKRIDASVRLLPLLRGAVEADNVELTSPKLNLEVDKEGRRNWAFHPAGKPAAATAPGPGASPYSFAVSRLQVFEGEASYLDQRDGRARTVRNIELAASQTTADGPADAKGSLSLNDEDVHFSVAVASLDGLRHGGAAASVSITSLPANIEFKGDIGLGRPARTAGTIAVKAPSLRRALAWFNAPYAPRETGAGEVSIDGRLDIAAGKIALAGAKIAIGGIAAQGELNLEDRGDRRLLSGSLQIDRLDLNPYLKAKTQPPPRTAEAPRAMVPGGVMTAPEGPPPPAIAAAPKPLSARPITLPPLQKLDAELNLSADSFHFRRFESGQTRVAAHLKDGRLDLAIADMALYGGTAGGDIVIDETGDQPSFSAKLTLSGIDIQPLLLAVSHLDPLSGKGNVSLDLTAQGNNPRDLVASLAGSGSIDLANGQLTGSYPFVTTLPGLEIANAPEKALPFSTLSASFAVSHGFLKNDDLRLSSPQLTATGKGLVNLAPCRIDYRWMPVLKDKGHAQIAIAGPCDNPTYRAMSVTITKGLLPPKPKR